MEEPGGNCRHEPVQKMVTQKGSAQPSTEEEFQEAEKVRLIKKNHDPLVILIFLFPDFNHGIGSELTKQTSH